LCLGQRGAGFSDGSADERSLSGLAFSVTGEGVARRLLYATVDDRHGGAEKRLGIGRLVVGDVLERKTRIRRLSLKPDSVAIPR
jgi:hypothetical protein